jgi:hypothetical protein
LVPTITAHDVLLVVGGDDEGVVAAGGVLRDAAGHERRLVVEVRLALDEEVGEPAAGLAFPFAVEARVGEEQGEAVGELGRAGVQVVLDRPRLRRSAGSTGSPQWRRTGCR